MIADYVTGKPVKETEKEKVRQEIARQLVHEYGIWVLSFSTMIGVIRARNTLLIIAPT
jgi:hypothetical protein